MRNKIGQFITIDQIQRFWAKVSKDGPVVCPDLGRCWIWFASAFPNGYGQFDKRGAHRFSYQLHKGKIPAGKQLDHLCRIRLCVNPDHLEPVTSWENMLRGKNRAIVEAKHEKCKRGHLLVEGNLVFRADRPKARECKICSNRRKREWERKHYDAPERSRRNKAAKLFR